MEQVIKDSIVQLALEGIRGNRDAFLLRLRKFISRLRAVDPDFAAALIDLLPVEGGLRGVGSFAIDAPVDADTRQRLISEEHPVILDTTPVWPSLIAKALSRVILEWTEQDELRKQGLSPIRSLLFSGPPGVGKTLAARWLAANLKLPLLTLDLSTVMSSYLGKTGNNIRSVLSYARSFPCVLLLDEFDAIAKKRDDETDVGELKRLVTVLLQAVDEWPDTSLLVAATNHEELLDPAIWRRFDLTLNIDRPTEEMIARFLEANGVPAPFCARFAKLLGGESFGTMEKRLNLAKKNAVLEKVPLISAFCELLLDSTAITSGDNAKTNLQILKCHIEGMSNREISKIVGVAHTTVGRTIKTLIGGEENGQQEHPDRIRRNASTAREAT